ncbi:MAG: FtsB family cell division protein [Flavisolibacter sp.]
MQVFSRIPSWLKNKYSLTLLAFVIWMIFFDAKDLITQRERARELHEMQESKTYYSAEIAKERKALEELKSNPAAIEKYAREKYLMKKDNEDLFVIQRAEKADKD